MSFEIINFKHKKNHGGGQENTEHNFNTDIIVYYHNYGAACITINCLIFHLAKIVKPHNYTVHIISTGFKMNTTLSTHGNIPNSIFLKQ